MTITLAVLLGFALDWLLGDPKKLPHPVCAVGKFISTTEKVLRRIFPRNVCVTDMRWNCTLAHHLRRELCRAVFPFALAVSCELLARFCRRNAALLDDFRTKKPCGRRLSCLRRDQAVARGGAQGHRVVRSAATPQSCPRRALSRPLSRPWLKT